MTLQARVKTPPNWYWTKTFERAIDPAITVREYLGNRSAPRSCRFCLRYAPDATFRMAAHVVPEAFGNRSLLSADECDSCNQIGSLFESDLANLLFGSRLISMLPSKKSAVKYRLGKSEAFVEATPSTRKLFIKPQPGDGAVRLRVPRDRERQDRTIVNAKIGAS